MPYCSASTRTAQGQRAMMQIWLRTGWAVQIRLTKSRRSAGQRKLFQCALSPFAYPHKAQFFRSQEAAPKPLTSDPATQAQRHVGTSTRAPPAHGGNPTCMRGQPSACILQTGPCLACHGLHGSSEGKWEWHGKLPVPPCYITGYSLGTAVWAQSSTQV